MPFGLLIDKFWLVNDSGDAASADGEDIWTEIRNFFC